MASPFDAVDYAILYHLQENARRPLTDIADAIGVADNTVRNRIETLEEEGVIEGYQANINYDQVGTQHYYVFFCTARVSEREQLAEDAREFPAVVEVITLMTGTNNVIIFAAATQKDDVTNFAYEIDELGLDIEQEHLIRRHHRQPFERFRLEETL